MVRHYIVHHSCKGRGGLGVSGSWEDPFALNYELAMLKATFIAEQWEMWQEWCEEVGVEEFMQFCE